PAGFGWVLYFYAGNLPFFPEVGQAQVGGGLVLLLAAHRHEDQHQDGDHIGHHLHQVGHGAGHRDAQDAGQELVQPVEDAEQVGAPDGVEGLPGGEDDQRQRQPAQGLDLLGGGPDALVVVQHIVQPAQPADGGAGAGGQVLVAGDVDAGGVGGGGVFAHRPQVEPGAGAGEEPVQRHSQQDGRIRQEAVTEQQLARRPQAGQHRDPGGESLVGQRGRAVGGAVQDEDAEEVGHAHAEGGQRQAGDVLVGPQRDGQEVVDQPAQRAGRQGADQR